MTADVATWERFLERLEVDLDAARTAFERGDEVRLGGFVPPKDLPTLPAACATRAKRVLDQQLAFEAAVAAKAGAIGTELSSRPGGGRSGTVAQSHRHHDPARHGARFETRV